METSTPWYLNFKLLFSVLIVATLVGGFAWISKSETARTALADWIHPGKSADQHDGHEHEHDDHAHGGNMDSLELSENGRKNIGYRQITVEVADFQKKLTLPATVVDRPGHTQIQIPAPMTGIVTKIYPIEGAAVKPGSPLFELRLTHEELVAAQREFLQTLGNLDVVQSELKRLESYDDGVVAGKKILEKQFEKQKLEAALQAERQALLLHDLSKAQIAGIEKSRQVVSTLTISAPADDGQKSSSANIYVLQQLPVKLGQQVEAGQPLAMLANQSLLYIEGHGFENDLPALRKALEKGWRVTAIPSGVAEDEDKLKDLELLYLSDRIETESRAIAFYLALPNPVESQRESNGYKFVQWKYRPGQRMELVIPVQEWEKQIVLPIEAVANDGAENYVFAENGKKFDRVAVHVLYRDLEKIIIEDDGSVFPGTVIAAHGAYQMQLALKNKAGGGIDPHAGHSH